MKSGMKFSLVMVIIAILLIALIQAGKKEHIDWNQKEYHLSQKKPYDLFILNKEFSNNFIKKPEVTEIQESIYSFFNKRKVSNPDKKAFVFIGSRFEKGKTATNKLLQFAQNGGTVFLASNAFDSYLLDTLHVGYTDYNSYLANNGTTNYPIKINLLKYGEEAVYDKIETPKLFNKLPAEGTTILGNLHVNKLVAPNFIRVRFGKGFIYLHLEPDIFTNYYVLQKLTSPIAFHSISYLEGKDIFWYNPVSQSAHSESPMRFILEKPALRAAWYTLLVALLFLLIFRSKREQRAIPILLPEENKSVEFVKTIGSVYYENGTPADMIAKKIQYFLFDLRRNLRLEINDLTRPEWIISLSNRTNLSKEEITNFIHEIIRLQSLKEGKVDDLKKVYHLIEDFKHKAKML